MGKEESKEFKKEKKKKYNLPVKLLWIFPVLVILAGMSYAAVLKEVKGTKNYAITVQNLELLLDESKTTTNILLENALPMKDEDGMKNPDYLFSLSNKGSNTVGYTIYLVENDYANKTPTSAIRYYYKRDAGEKEVTRNMDESQKENGKFILESGTIQGGETYNYIYKMWLNYNTGNEVLNTQYSVHLEIKATMMDSNSAEVKLFASDNLGTNCKTYNDGIDTFLVGQCQNNYVWYSGKLWRVVLKNNETGAVKMVTDNAITAIPYNASGNIKFEDSFMDQWLNQEFLPTLHDYQDYLVVDSTWDVTLDNSTTPARPVGTTPATRTVGLLNAYEYYTTYNNSDGLATYETGYLNNSTNWWLITPYSASDVRYVGYNGTLNYRTPAYGHIARPSINLKSTIRISQGSGTQTDPYRLEGDSQEMINGTTLLSTRYSGEYITFNNELYRIVGVEDSKTKITAVDKPATLSSNQFHSDNNVISFASSSIKTDLETYYQNDIIEPYKLMIEPNTLWYLGTVGEGVNYKASICKTVDIKSSASACERTDTTATATVGLPRVGEMFTSQITRGTKAQFWMLTPYSASYVRSAYINGNLNYNGPSQGCGVRPSMYLKSSVVISKNNTGDGTYEHPYDIELGS